MFPIKMSEQMQYVDKETLEKMIKRHNKSV